MRLTKARIAPLADSELDDEQREVLERVRRAYLSIFRTMAPRAQGAEAVQRVGGSPI
ncbi:hypothetical protein [Sphingomonas panacisoli]|uniref:hypothetical protein n=1 Tax=Sphingomonas panacisoli TaxID=1813879 RepID=UPI001647C886|nr:hypothetical protein [Sphingomonas panacisoli]